MRSIGLLGGMSWESTALYYRLLNEAVRDRVGAAHSAPVLLHSFDFEPIAQMQAAGKWDDLADVLARAAQGLEAAGAELVAICANTMHKVAPQVEASVGIPLVHIADATGDAVRAAGLERVGLLGTAYTMEGDFISGRLAQRYGLEVLVPDPTDRDLVHRCVYDELIKGVVNQDSRDAHVEVIVRLVGRGAEGVILGCTEQELLIRPHDVPLPIFPTTGLHVDAILAAAGVAAV